MKTMSGEEQGAQAQICPQCGELVQKAMKAHKKKDCKQRMVPKAFENPADVDPDEISGERTRTSACSEPPPPDPEGRSAASSGGTVVGTVVELSEQSERVMAAFAEHHKMPLKEVRDLFAQLNEEQRWLTCMRFRYDPNKSGVPAIKLLQLFVHSCQTNGFRERHPLDRDPDGCFDQILKKADVQPTLQRGDPLLKKEAVQSTPQRGEPTLKKEDVQSTPQRGDPTLKKEDVQSTPQRGDPIPKKEGVQPALQRGDSIPKKEDVQSTPQRGDPTLKQEDVQSTPQHGDAIRKKEEVQPTLRQGGTLPGASHPSSQPNVPPTPPPLVPPPPPPTNSNSLPNVPTSQASQAPQAPQAPKAPPTFQTPPNVSPTAQTAASSGGASSGPDGAGPEWPRPALSDVLDLAVELRRRVELLEMEKEHLVRALQAAFEKVAELEGENWRLKEAAQFFEAAAEERERQLKDPHQTERPLHVLHGASNVAMPRFRGSTAAPLRRSATDPTSSREDGSMPGSPIDAPVHARPEAGYQAEVPEDDSRCDAQWPNYHVIAHGFQSQ